MELFFKKISGVPIKKRFPRDKVKPRYDPGDSGLAVDELRPEHNVGVVEHPCKTCSIAIQEGLLSWETKKGKK